MAEIEFSVLSRSCLKQRALRRGPDPPAGSPDALVTERNAARATINWRFNTQARHEPNFTAFIPSDFKRFDY